MSIVDSIVGFAQANPFLVVAILFFLYKKWQSSQPWPDFGGRLTKVHNCKEWDELLKPANRLVVIDAYALWCPPCKAAAPVYAKLSEEFTPETCCFAKVDVDEARDVAQRLGISAMPTFKVSPVLAIDLLSFRPYRRSVALPFLCGALLATTPGGLLLFPPLASESLCLSLAPALLCLAARAVLQKWLRSARATRLVRRVKDARPDHPARREGGGEERGVRDAACPCLARAGAAKGPPCAERHRYRTPSAQMRCSCGPLTSSQNVPAHMADHSVEWGNHPARTAGCKYIAAQVSGGGGGRSL